jgi:ribosome-associated protein
LATRKTTGAGTGGEGRESIGRAEKAPRARAAGKSAAGAAEKTAAGKAPRAKVGARPRLKVGSRPVSAAPREPVASSRRAVAPASDAPAAPRAKAAATPAKASVPPPPGAVPTRARAAVKPVKKASAKDDPGRRVALAIAAAGFDKKAVDIEIVDVRGRVDYADYVVVMSGRSERQVSALARNIEEDLLKKHKVRCAGVEGLGQGAWVLMDFGDVIVHVFHEDTRGYYDLDSLWGDAPRVEPESQV